jgi:hypothetical protein
LPKRIRSRAVKYLSAMRNGGILIVLIMLLSGCGENEETELRNQFRWISGQWEGQNGSVTLLERWKWDKTQYVGEGYELQGSDTLFSEKLFIRSFDGKPVYVASLPKSGVTLFEGIKSDSTWVFENKDHDFPSRIQYQIEADSAFTISLFAKGEHAHRGEHSYQLVRMK